VKITHSDFEQLTINSTSWKTYSDGWKDQEGRFENIEFSIPELPIDYEYERAYWVETYPGVLFVKAFLEALGHDYRVYFDTADDTYMITTNYGSEIARAVRV